MDNVVWPRITLSTANGLGRSNVPAPAVDVGLHPVFMSPDRPAMPWLAGLHCSKRSFLSGRRNADWAPKLTKVQVRRYKNTHLEIHWRPQERPHVRRPRAERRPRGEGRRLLCAQSRVGPRAGQERSAPGATLQEPAVGVTPQAQPPRGCKARPQLPSERQYVSDQVGQPTADRARGSRRDTLHPWSCTPPPPELRGVSADSVLCPDSQHSPSFAPHRGTCCH